MQDLLKECREALRKRAELLRYQAEHSYAYDSILKNGDHANPNARQNVEDAALMERALAFLFLAQEQGVEGWQPVESAPKNTKARLVWCPERQNVYLVSWWCEFDGTHCRWEHFGGYHQQLEEPATHWLSLDALPPPPSPEEAEPSKANPAPLQGDSA